MRVENKTVLTVALAGNPNVGKSTVFNQLTGLRQHTGNWPGKTVANARGFVNYKDKEYVLVDVPGCYSLMAHSAEEEAARDFICFGQPDGVVVVCDGVCLERNLNLVLQILEVTKQVIVCVNLMDEAEKKGIFVNLEDLEKRLGVPVVGTSARNGKGLDALLATVDNMMQNGTGGGFQVTYPACIERAVKMLEQEIKRQWPQFKAARFLSVRLLEGDPGIQEAMINYFGKSLFQQDDIKELMKQMECQLRKEGIGKEQMKDQIAAAYGREAEKLANAAVQYKNMEYQCRDRKLDWLFTSKITGFPIMFLMLMFIFWLTITGANYPSQILNTFFLWTGEKLSALLMWIGAPTVVLGIIVNGAYRVLTWVVSVMLPPMAIFFPLFTLMEDFGYLPRVAFNLDKCFKKCHACGKQALTMCMGFGCNAAGVVGCRIIDSKRERLIAMLTNNFVPCNGRYPAMIAMISMFFLGTSSGAGPAILPAFILAMVIVLGIGMTLLVSRILSATLLKGIPSSFTLELPPYRKPQVGRVIVRSMLDRTLFVLGRAAAVAAPAGIVLWLMANITIGGSTILYFCTRLLDPFGKLLGMDGVIITAFLLGLPANEIVIPIMIMAYMAQGKLVEINDITLLKQLLLENGWTWITAVNVVLFSLMHWPCATTLLTIRKESGSIKWTIAAFLIPALAGITICFLFTRLAQCFL